MNSMIDPRPSFIQMITILLYSLVGTFTMYQFETQYGIETVTIGEWMIHLIVPFVMWIILLFILCGEMNLYEVLNAGFPIKSWKDVISVDLFVLRSSGFAIQSVLYVLILLIASFINKSFQHVITLTVLFIVCSIGVLILQIICHYLFSYIAEQMIELFDWISERISSR